MLSIADCGTQRKFAREENAFVSVKLRVAWDLPLPGGGYKPARLFSFENENTPGRMLAENNHSD